MKDSTCNEQRFFYFSEIGKYSKYLVLDNIDIKLSFVKN